MYFFNIIFFFRYINVLRIISYILSKKQRNASKKCSTKISRSFWRSKKQKVTIWLWSIWKSFGNEKPGLVNYEKKILQNAETISKIPCFWTSSRNFFRKVWKFFRYKFIFLGGSTECDRWSVLLNKRNNFFVWEIVFY